MKPTTLLDVIEDIDIRWLEIRVAPETWASIKQALREGPTAWTDAWKFKPHALPVDAVAMILDYPVFVDESLSVPFAMVSRRNPCPLPAEVNAE